MLIYNNENFIINNEFAENVEKGLLDKPKHVSPKFFYDKIGSKLFEEICDQPEYYLNRVEAQILKNSASEIINALDKKAISVIELGNGNSQKTRILLQPFLANWKTVSYFPIDVSEIPRKPEYCYNRFLQIGKLFRTFPLMFHLKC